MKARTLTCLAALVLAAQLLVADPFDCGSTGAYGPMNITADTTLDLPPDGIFHCTTITVQNGVTLTFNQNELNTPVYLFATGDVLVDGAISLIGGTPSSRVPGRGAPGGFDGGYGGSTIAGQDQGGSGLGPGGGSGAFTYGNILCDPLIGGSGGNGSSGTPGLGGYGGSGAILIASNTRITINGAVYVQANGPGGYGDDRYASPGAIRLASPIVTGTGGLFANRHTDAFGNPHGTDGRIRIDCSDSVAYRNLTTLGQTTRGSRMIALSTNVPQLDIIEVAGTVIPEGTNSPVQIELTTGDSTNQTVKVQARNFAIDVPIRLVITPENGPRASFDAIVLKASGNPPYADVPVVIPAGSVCQIHVWTR